MFKKTLYYVYCAVNTILCLLRCKYQCTVHHYSNGRLRSFQAVLFRAAAAATTILLSAAGAAAILSAAATAANVVITVVAVAVTAAASTSAAGLKKLFWLKRTLSLEHEKVRASERNRQFLLTVNGV